MGAKGLPKSVSRVGSKKEILHLLMLIDGDISRRERVLKMETVLRANIDSHLKALPTSEATFAKLNTSPYVLLFYSRKQQYSHVSQIEKDIIPAKVFSSIETAAGNLIQKHVLPFYGWEVVDSSMHSQNSVIDVKKREGDLLRLITLKSGPRCLNDEMSKDIAQDIVEHSMEWAREEGVDQVEFTYGALYGTEKTSNKKDWHVLRNISEMKGSKFMIESPQDRWSCSFKNQGTTVGVKVMLGKSLWEHVGDDFTMIEIATALVRASVVPSSKADREDDFSVSDFAQITSLSEVPDSYNVSLLQRTQLQWLFFYLRHFYDDFS